MYFSNAMFLNYGDLNLREDKVFYILRYNYLVGFNLVCFKRGKGGKM